MKNQSGQDSSVRYEVKRKESLSQSIRYKESSEKLQLLSRFGFRLGGFSLHPPPFFFIWAVFFSALAGSFAKQPITSN